MDAQLSLVDVIPREEQEEFFRNGGPSSESRITPLSFDRPLGSSMQAQGDAPNASGFLPLSPYVPSLELEPQPEEVGIGMTVIEGERPPSSQPDAPRYDDFAHIKTSLEAAQAFCWKMDATDPDYPFAAPTEKPSV